MAHGQTDSCLDDGDAGAYEHSGHEQRGPLMSGTSGVQPLFDRAAVNRTDDEHRAARGG